MATTVIDAEALKEFLDKADLPADYLARLSQELAERHEAARLPLSDWAQLWHRAPVVRRISEPERQRWEPRLTTVLPALWQGHVGALWDLLDPNETTPAWLADWGTYWAHLAHPQLPWWARWVYRPDSRTGALLLVVDDVERFNPDLAGPVLYQRIREAVSFLGAVLDSTHQLDAVEEMFRPMVALAIVYAVYMFTMASWKMTEEFTQVLPSFPSVVRILLGLTRWEGKSIGPKSESD